MEASEMTGQVCLTQLEITEQYQTSKQNIGKHIKTIIADRQLSEAAVVNQKFTTAADGKDYRTHLYAPAEGEQAEGKLDS